MQGEEPVVGEVTEKAKDLICDEFNEHLCDCTLITEKEEKENENQVSKVLYLLLPAVSAPIVLILMIVMCACWCKGRKKLSLKENVEGGVAGGELGQEDQRGQVETDHDYNPNQGRPSIDSGPISDDRYKPAKLSPSKLVFNRVVEHNDSGLGLRPGDQSS